ncbi:MAG: TetR/AcrR family transcriptional regulator [Muribaculaceae bacterium]|nr:TetR/AcrR family transcriptional regulator [Muribaculaceae bacterium]MBR0023476.1 TetR/AcrR family transcriptional regulator [Muribaculaceae bacterium]
MDLREKILKTSMDLMMRIGPQSVTMDMVARDCGISKRTLYETFPNKHNLISDVIEYNQQQANAKFTQIFEQSANSFEALMGVYTVAREFIRKTSPVFIADIKRLYPEAFEQYKAQEIDHILSLAKIIKRAKDEGLALPGVKCKIAAFIFTNNMKSIHNMQDFPFPEYTAAEVFDGAFLNFMRGIATTRGQEIIENYVVNTLSNKEN